MKKWKEKKKNVFRRVKLRKYTKSLYIAKKGVKKKEEDRREKKVVYIEEKAKAKKRETKGKMGKFASLLNERRKWERK